MKLLRARRLTAWIALAVMLMGALAPTVSHALALARSGMPGAVEVCTSSGMRWVVLEAVNPAASPAARSKPIPTDSPDGQESALSLNHCPFCLPIADRLGPPPAASLHFFNAETGLAQPDAQALFFETFTPSSALPRGPPVFS